MYETKEPPECSRYIGYLYVVYLGKNIYRDNDKGIYAHQECVKVGGMQEEENAWWTADLGYGKIKGHVTLWMLSLQLHGKAY